MNDLIERQAAIDALDVLCQEHRYKIPGKSETYSQYNEAWQDALDRAEGAIFNLPSAQPEPCEDAVSRQAAIDAVNQYNFDFPQYMERFVTELRDAMKADLKHDIEALPPEQPEIIVCADCKHWICHDRRCGYWNHGVKPLDYCSYAEGRADEAD